MTAAIEIHGLVKAFGSHTVLAGIDLTVAPGEVFALLGPNGAGKTTTIGTLTTLVTPDAGTVRVLGHDVIREPGAVRRRIALTGQAAAVDEVLTARENLTMFATLLGIHPARRRATELLERFDLTDAADRRVGTFSGGMRRRLDLALSFVGRPEVIFLDEPTTGLDTRSRRGLWEVIRALAGAGTTVFLTTQYLEEADQLADRVAVLADGRIAALGTAAELKARIGGATVELRDDADRILREIPTDGTAAGMRRALANVEDGALVSLRRPSLDDVFLTLTDPHATQKEHA